MNKDLKNINTRLREVRRCLFDDVNIKFAEALSKNPNVTSNWVREGYNVGRGVASEVAEKLNISLNWLMTGEGEMLKDSKVTTQNSYSLPLIPINVVAGFPDGDLQGIILSDCEQYVIPEFKTLKAEYMIRVSGSSMYPKYSNGDILACRKLHSINFFQWGKIYVLDTEQGALVKRLFEDKSDLENIICHSDNSDRYPDFVLPKSEIRSISIVLGVIRIE